MPPDLSRLSIDDLQAVASGDMSRVSTEGLRLISGAEQPQAAPRRDATFAEKVAADPFVGFAAAAAEPVFGLSQLSDRGLKALGWENNPYGYLARSGEEFQKMRKFGLEDRGSTGMDVPRLMGNVMSPVGLVAGKAIPAATTGLGRAVQATTLSGAAGAGSMVDNPEDNYWGQKGVQFGSSAATGGILSGLATGIGKVGRTAYHGLWEPLTKAGRADIKGREFGLAAGEQKDRLVQALLHPQQIVPGSRPTAGEVAAEVGAPVMANVQKQAAEALPEIYNLREIGQNAARRAEVRSVGGTADDLAKAIANRKTVADLQYSSLRPRTMDVLDDPEYARLLAHPYISDRVPEAAKLSAARGLSFNRGDSPYTAYGNVENLRQELGAALRHERAKTDANGNKIEILSTALRDLNGWIEQKLPAAAIARKTYERLSRGINTMEAGQTLEKALGDKVSAYGLNAPQNAKSFTAALEAVPKGTFDARQTAKMEGVAADLSRKGEMDRLAAKGSQAAPDLYGFAAKQMERETGGAGGPNILHRGMMLANAVLKRVQGRANEKLALEMAKDMLEPPEVARLIMQADTPSKRKALVDAIVQSGGFRGGKAALPAALINQGIY